MPRRSRSIQFPAVFGVVKIQPDRAPFLHVYTAEYRSVPEDYFIIRNWSEENQEDVTGYVNEQFLSHDIQTVAVKDRNQAEVQKIKYWSAPLRVFTQTTRVEIPILDFQVRSWLPRGADPIRLDMERADASRLERAIRDVAQARLAKIRTEEQAHPWSHLVSTEDHDDRLQRLLESDWVTARERLRPSVRQEPEIRVLEVQVPRERVVVQTRTAPLPNSVGQVLLEHARKGTESCPIAATPFSESERLCVTSCFHIFDAPSLAQWQTSHTTCPVCRTVPTNVISEDC